MRALTRRRALAAAGTGLGLGLAGCALPGLGSRAGGDGQARRAAVLYPEVAGGGRAVADAVLGRLRQVGLAAERLSWSAAEAPGGLDPRRHGTLVLPDAALFPAAAAAALVDYLQPAGAGARAGNLVAVGGPFLSQPMQRSPSGWQTIAAAQLQAAAASAPVIAAAPSAWAARGATAGDRPRFSGQPRDFTLQIPNLTNWGNGQIPVRAPAFPPEHSLTRFAARGLGTTRCFIVEWDEADGSRWIATVRVGADWQGFALRPQAFAFWPDPPVRGRGGAGDRLNPARAVRLSIGVDTAHCGPVSGPQAVEVRDFGTDSGTAAGAPPDLPRLTGLWPVPADDADEAFVIPDPVRLVVAGGPGPAVRLPDLEGVAGAISPAARSRGLGWPGAAPAAPLPPHRFVPLVRALDAGGTVRGAPGAAILHAAGRAAGAIWLILGLPESALGTQAGYAAEFVAQALTAFLGQARLWYGGAPLAVTAGAPLSLGARLLPGVPTDPPPAFTLDGVPIAPGAAAPRAPGPHALTVTTGGDRLDCPVRVCASPPARRQGPVTVAAGDLRADGAPWRPVGVNYWPRSTSGLAADVYAAGWLSPLLYDPDVVEADLAALERLGCNLVSGIQYARADQAPALRDFLARCDAHGIRATLYIAGGEPLSPDPAQLLSLIRAADLGGDTAVAAYELAWEPHLGPGSARTPLQAAWQAWVADQYGSMRQAQQAWGYIGGDSGPTDPQLLQDGPWAPMVAAYRRFLDDRITAGYGAAWTALRSAGDAHLLTARTGYGGTGQAAVVTQMPFDLASGALYLDLICPEAWGLGAGEAATGGLTTAYARAVGAGKPVVWMEFGSSIWGDPAAGAPAQGALYAAILAMVERSGASGASGWWFPGGLRVDEGSDYGVFNADGTPRPAAQALGAAARRLRGQPSAGRTPDVWLDADRDRYVQGYAGIWAAQKAAYAADQQTGRVPGVRLPGAGTTSADCPLVAVGGTTYAGVGPLQALNGTFTRVEAGGRPVADGERVAAPAVVTVTAGNTGPAAWGADVRLTADLPGGGTVRAPLAAAPVAFLGFGTFAPLALPAGVGQVALRLEARGGVRFGPVFRLRVGP